MDTITDVTGVSVPVGDQDDAAAFFTASLGFEIRRDVRMDGRPRWLTVAAPGAGVEVALVPDADHVGHETGIRFATTDAAAAHHRLAERGVSLDELLRWPGVPPMFKFSDPDGNTYTMIEAS